ncbi:hypothetical protein U1299_05450 [Enterococcus cecorum]|uniref:DUF669 domain-containing protein n=1 Tax=Enterococcus cecorum TaxID=44008 RepID=A0AAW9JUU3_9ENTE|nr:hypothetical protein [Enterococcus cecorum]MCJ0572358.1 hypothetical protein [Enterococcus cecorum]MCJ0577218.1 hypothetical protein [Enterococcus cecorum]MCJ0584253.1 hypothetical protein [Enterococcus cecorum]MCJ0589572.1 hypothetical protein [Enterococcus cecorum]MDZ5504172.1 hypothetical protein [Enterococcus cecorum]
MSLKDYAQKVLENFDPKKDDPNAGSNNGLPEGEFDVVLNNVEFKVFEKSGWEALSITLEVTVGEYAGQREFINLGFGEDLHEFVLSKNIKVVSKLASVIGLVLTDEDWEDEQTLAAAFKDSIGSQFVLTKTLTPNKKEPTRPYANYDFVAYDEEDMQAIEAVEVSDEELPF